MPTFTARLSEWLDREYSALTSWQPRAKAGYEAGVLIGRLQAYAEIGAMLRSECLPRNSPDDFTMQTGGRRDQP